MKAMKKMTSINYVGFKVDIYEVDGKEYLECRVFNGKNLIKFLWIRPGEGFTSQLQSELKLLRKLLAIELKSS